MFDLFVGSWRVLLRYVAVRDVLGVSVGSKRTFCDYLFGIMMLGGRDGRNLGSRAE